MIFISHRGNLTGPQPERENSLSFIDEAIERGYDVEIDLRMENGQLYLGHDHPEYFVDYEWLLKRSDNLWIHIKDYESLIWISSHHSEFRYFCHESDRYTLTSNGYIWSHDLQNKMTDKCIVPLINRKQVFEYDQWDYYAVCTDFVIECEERWKKRLQ